MSRKTTVKPRSTRIGRGPLTDRLYALEERRSETIQAAAKELGKVLHHDLADYWTESVPQALFDILEGFETPASIAAATSFLEMYGYTVTSPKIEKCCMPECKLTALQSSVFCQDHFKLEGGGG